MDEKLPFYSYSQYLKEKYGTKAYRIAVDGGFSCPNRGKDRNSPGCIFCCEQGSRASYLDTAEAMEEQISRGISFTKGRYKADVFLLYFQAFSSTFDTVSNLKKIYDAALEIYPFRELIIGTRPDCIDEKKADLLASYIKPDFDVWIELGLQSANDKTLRRINRGHTAAQYEAAFSILRSRGIKISTHLILGLPDESWEDMAASIDFVNTLHPEAVKFHDLNITYNTPLFDEYLKGETTVPPREKYLEYLIKCLEMLREDIVIMRTTCDTYEKDRVAPRFYLKKGNFTDNLLRKMMELQTYQGRVYKS